MMPSEVLHVCASSPRRITEDPGGRLRHSQLAGPTFARLAVHAAQRFNPGFLPLCVSEPVGDRSRVRDSCHFIDFSGSSSQFRPDFRSFCRIGKNG